MAATQNVRTAADETFAEALLRAKAEYIEMPGMQLTVAQAARLWHVDRELCDAVLAALVETRFLTKTRHALFARAA